MHSSSSRTLAQRAFSLVELSIVLVILGLLIGGILSGQALIRAAELRAVSTEYSRYVAAVQTFRDKYFALPGDMNNAIQFWDAAHATPATCYSTSSTTKATCNGNGDGFIYFDTSTSNEPFRFWQHLANAGLIEGQYSGVLATTHVHSTTTANAPRGKIANSFWFAHDWANVKGTALSGNIYYFAGNYGNTLVLGAFITDYSPNNPVLKPEEAWNIDTKLDDGKPGTGKMAVLASTGLSTCTTTVTNNPATITADYLLSASNATCALIFRGLF
jgi:prepilin-type N-terminal cleavage/methylation domain-containing protein